MARSRSGKRCRRCVAGGRRPLVESRRIPVMPKHSDPGRAAAGRTKTAGGRSALIAGSGGRRPYGIVRIEAVEKLQNARAVRPPRWRRSTRNPATDSSAPGRACESPPDRRLDPDDIVETGRNAAGDRRCRCRARSDTSGRDGDRGARARSARDVARHCGPTRRRHRASACRTRPVANWSRLVLPMQIAPASSSVDAARRLLGHVSEAGTRAVVGMPATSMLSLTPNGTPNSGRCSPALRRCFNVDAGAQCNSVPWLQVDPSGRPAPSAGSAMRRSARDRSHRAVLCNLRITGRRNAAQASPTCRSSSRAGRSAAPKPIDGFMQANCRHIAGGPPAASKRKLRHGVGNAYAIRAWIKACGENARGARAVDAERQMSVIAGW